MLHPKRSPRSRFVLTLLAAVLMLSLAAGCGKKESKVAAEYDGGQVTTKEFTAYKTFLKILQPTYESLVDEDSMQEGLISQYVGIKILSGRASDTVKAEAVKEADTQFDSLKQSIQADASSKKDVEKKMKDGGLTYDLMKQFIEEQFTMSKDAESKVTDADISSYYDKNKDSFILASVRHILIGLTDKNQKTRTDDEALKLAKDVEDKLKAGGDWTALAKEYSDDSGSADKGGLYEDTLTSGYVEEFKNAANTLPIGEISDPVKTTYGYHVMKVEKRDYQSLDKSKDSIRSTLGSDSISKFMSDELPKLIKSTNVPKPSPAASPSASASASPSASASASPSASASGQ